METQSAWKSIDEAESLKMEALVQDYIAFISENKTERECVTSAIALAEAPTQGQDIFHYAPKSAGAEDYESVCNELLTEIK